MWPDKALQIAEGDMKMVRINLLHGPRAAQVQVHELFDGQTTKVLVTWLLTMGVLGVLLFGKEILK